MINIAESDVNELLGITSRNGGNVVFQSGNIGESAGGIKTAESSVEDDGLIKIIPYMDMKASVTQRFEGAPWFNGCKNTSVLVIGAGGISSWTVLALSRLGLKAIYVYDRDLVTTYNMAGQFYRQGNIGDNKVYALFNNVRMYSPDCNIHYDARNITDSYTISDSREECDIIISGVDSMRSRQDIYKCLINNGFTGLYIDGRLSADAFQVVCVDFSDDNLKKRYKKELLFDDDEADRLACSFKQTTYMAMMIASVINNIVVNRINNKTNLVEYNIPFFVEYDAIRMQMECRKCQSH